MADKKEIKRGLPGKRTTMIAAGDKFMIDPNDFLRVPGIGLFYNRSNYAVIMEFLPEDIRREG